MKCLIKNICIISILILTGCSDKYITCTINLENNLNNYKQESIYKIYYKDSYVLKIVKIDNYESSSEDEINYLYDTNKLILDSNIKYGSFVYNIQKNESSIKISTTIDIDNIDLNSMVLDEKISRDYIVSNKLLLSGIIDIYESKGAHCNE